MADPDAALAQTLPRAEEVAGDDRYRLLRGRADDGTRFLLKLPARTPAPPEDVAGLKREYEILRRPPVAAAMRALDLVCDDAHCVLVLEDTDDAPLASLVATRSIPIGGVIDYTLQIVDALAGLHRAGIVHRALSPRSVFVQPQSGRIRLADFADAARDAAEACVPLARHQYRARLPYAAPEQTGRINRGCDARTDFYALGAVLYELLTGRPPFIADDPLELMHAHLARPPVPPADLVAGVPAPLSAIVLKLLAKQPEERYQSACGLAFDLQQCRREWADTGTVADFTIGARDVSDQFAIPDRLFGREAERELLLAAFARACAGAPVLAYVEGPAGIGKTALIRELQGPVSRRRGHFVSGKFDQLSRDVPYGALSQALRQRVQRILAAPPDHVARERDRLGAALGAHAAVIAELVPEIEDLLGRQGPAPALDATEAQNRFTLAFQNFLSSLAAGEAPLVVFLDDLQWADPSTLALLAPLLSSPQVHHVLVIVAARPAEAGAASPLADVLADVAAAGVALQRIALGPLDVSTLEQLLQAVLRLPAEPNAALARVLHAKSLGNPFFATQVLSALHGEGVIAFDRDAWAWTCRMDGLARVAIADNVIDLLAQKLDRLPAATQQVLTVAACLGNRFDAQTLASVCGQAPRAALDELEPAVRAGLLAAETGQVFTFIHDRVQQAAYARLDADERSRLHLRIGRLLWGDRGLDGNAADFDGLFEAVSHLNLGVGLIEAPAERLALAQLNLAAGARAKAAAAYRAALGYFSAGRDQLAPSHWDTQYELAFALHLEAAQCEYLCGHFDAATRRFEALLLHAASDLDRARVCALRAVQHENMARYDLALAEARGALGFLGVLLPAEATAKDRSLQAEIDRIDRLLGHRPIEALIDLPPLADSQTRLAMRLLTNAWASAYILGDATLARLISALLVRQSLEHGLAEESAYGFVTHAITAGPVRGDYDAAWAWGTLALAVVDKLDARRLRAKVFQQFHAHVELWRQPFARCVERAHAACRSGLENGDFLYAAYGASTAAWPALAASQDLAQFAHDFEPNLALLAQLRNTAFADALRLMIGWAGALQRAVPGATCSLSGPAFDEAAYAATYRDNPFFSMFHAIARLHVCFTLDDAAGAAQAADAVRATAASLVGMQWSVQFAFLDAMRLAVAFDGLEPQGGVAALERLAAAQSLLAPLARSAPENFRCHAMLLDAEHARLTARPMEAMAHYENAVAWADETGHVQQQALANERCGGFFLERGNRKVAALYLQAALAAYARWGAFAKVRQLRARHGGLLGGAAVLDDGRMHADAALDVATLDKVARAIGSGEELDGALRQMLATAIQTAGASHGVLVELRDDQCLALAEGAADGAAVALLASPAVHETPLRCSPELVAESLRTGRELALAGAALEARSAQDAYLAAARPKAVACVPALHQGRSVALLYLENFYARDAFSAERMQVLRILAAQVATALASARLVERFRAEMTERQRAEQQLRAIEMSLATVTGGNFFRVLVRNLAQALEVRHVFVAECLRTDGPEGPAGGIARSRAFWSGDDFGPDFEYRLAGTPCLGVVEGQVCHFAGELQHLFPADKALRRWEAASYAGVPLLQADGRVIGHLVVVDGKPMPDASQVLALLRVSAGRAGAELERLKADEGRQRALAEIEALKNRLQEENIYLRRELIANVSHDLRSPLASLRGYLETLLIKEDSLSEADRHSYLTIALRQAEQLQGLITELFDLARLDFDGYRIAAEPLHVGELARDVAQRFQLAASEKGVALQLDVDDRAGLVQADIALIERTIANLLDNALAHTAAGGHVRLAVARGTAGVRIDVGDTGIGIPAQDLPRVFERFYRVDKARSLSKAGSGLGLAIVKRIVELHGSEIHVESEVGVGTRFWFELADAR